MSGVASTVAVRLRRYDPRGRESMKPLIPRFQATIQLKLPLPQGLTWVVPDDKQAELVRALVELLIGAAHVGLEDGGDDESEADR
jgi:hypothetical protein